MNWKMIYRNSRFLRNQISLKENLIIYSIHKKRAEFQVLYLVRYPTHLIKDHMGARNQLQVLCKSKNIAKTKTQKIFKLIKVPKKRTLFYLIWSRRKKNQLRTIRTIPRRVL